MPWAKFIGAHLGAVVGMDLLTVEAVTWLGLVRYHVLFAIDIASRKVEILGAAANPGGSWMEPNARNLVDAVDGFPLGRRYVSTDRDPLYTKAFREILKRGTTRASRTRASRPARSWTAPAKSSVAIGLAGFSASTTARPPEPGLDGGRSGSDRVSAQDAARQ